MIARYAIDASYIVGLARDPNSITKLNGFLIYMKLVSKLNTIFVADFAKQCLSPIQKFDIGDNILLRETKILLEDFQGMFTACEGIVLSSGSDEPEAYIGRLLDGCAKALHIDIVITNNNTIDVSGGKIGEVTDIDGFSECHLRCSMPWIGKQTWFATPYLYKSQIASETMTVEACTQYKKKIADEKVRFEDYIDRALFRARELELIDKYIGNCLLSNRYYNSHRLSLAYWIIQCIKSGISSLTITTMYPDGNLPKANEFTKKLNEQIEKLKPHSISVGHHKLRITIDLIARDPLDQNDADRNDAFHDRFIVSNAHYFSIGSGLDIVGWRHRSLRWRVFNTYFCGKRYFGPTGDSIPLSNSPEADLDIVSRFRAKESFRLILHKRANNKELKCIIDEDNYDCF